MNYSIAPHCDGIGCPLKDKCKRNEYFRKTGNSGIKRYDVNNSFIAHPFIIDNGMFKCEMFVGDPSEMLLVQVKTILSNGNRRKK